MKILLMVQKIQGQAPNMYETCANDGIKLPYQLVSERRISSINSLTEIVAGPCWETL